LVEQNGYTPIFMACFRGHLSVVTYLNENANVNVCDSGRDGETPLHGACKHGSTDVVEYLMKNGANGLQKNDVCLTIFDFQE